MAERNVLAYFNSEEEAQAALDQMAGLRIADSSIRRVDRMPGSGFQPFNSPIASEYTGLGSRALGDGFSHSDAGILGAASVSASGMSTGGPDNKVTGRNVLLTVVVDEQDYAQAVRIASEGGAAV